MLTRSTFLRGAITLGAAVAFAPSKIEKLLLPEAAAAPASVIPVGTVGKFVPGGIPDGWLLCDGRPVAKTEYRDLFVTLKNYYGGWRPGREFRLPDFRGRVVAAPSTQRQLAANSHHPIAPDQPHDSTPPYLSFVFAVKA